MIKASRYFPDYQFVVAGAPGIEADFYRRYMDADTKIVFGETYRLLSHATAALVTSGTATLETALFPYASGSMLLHRCRKTGLAIETYDSKSTLCIIGQPDSRQGSRGPNW